MANVYEILDIESNQIQIWDEESVLEEINRDRSDEWRDYDETDVLEGWFEWVEGEFLKMLTRNGEAVSYGITLTDGILKKSRGL